MTRVKICGLTRPQDVELAIELGADAVGFILEPSSPRFLQSTEELTRLVPPFVQAVGVFGKIYDRPLNRLGAVQAVGWEGASAGTYRRIRAVRLKPEDKATTVAELGSNYDALLLDAYREGQYGGTGERVNWEVAAEVVRHSKSPVILAGGLTPENVADAVQEVEPFAVDVSSGVESAPGVKDAKKMRDFIQAVRDSG